MQPWHRFSLGLPCLILHSIACHNPAWHGFCLGLPCLLCLGLFPWLVTIPRCTAQHGTSLPGVVRTWATAQRTGFDSDEHVCGSSTLWQKNPSGRAAVQFDLWICAKHVSLLKACGCAHSIWVARSIFGNALPSRVVCCVQPGQACAAS